ncbi:type I glyceraldehyde-3-phosphate dehydrogenase, partial [Acaryochloris sp. IP29b_bin.148]|uniref:type I glyceraldehyde-3-phosphate dehydrogenase n=1 Tax=Acaryochloris sp. IP29b_bin.148 TaxID=2969218 RepID=UPI002618440C
DPKTNAHLLTYDSMLGRLDADIKAVDNTIVANGKVIKCVSDRNPSNLPWGDWDIDMVIESTGVFVTKEGASKHIEAGAKKVLITAPGKGGVGMYVVGVNHEDYDPSEAILSNASCTTNCLAPVVKILHEQFGIVHGLMTTTHSYTGDQRILDASHRDLRRARAAAVNIVPTSTGAAKAVGTVIPALAGKLNGIALRVPTPNVSVCDFVAQTEKPAIAESVNEVIKQASEGSMKGIIAFNEEPLVSGDFKGHDCSSIVDGSLTMGMGGNMIKVVAWYDNEWGYSQRVLDLAEYVAEKW